MLIIDGETLNLHTTKSLMTKIAYELCKEHDLYVIIAHYDGGYDVTVSERMEKCNALVCSDEFEDYYDISFAIADVVHSLMNKIWA